MPRTLLLLAAALSAAALLLAEPARCSAARPSAAEKKIEEALATPTQLEFIETPLQDVIDYLKDFHRIEIQVDRKALSDVGLDASTLAITKNLKGVSLRSALNLMLREQDLTYLVEDEVLLITTAQAGAGRLTTKVYRVADLVATDDPQQQAQNRDLLIHVITATVAPESWVGGSASWGGGMGGMGGPGMPGPGPGVYGPGPGGYAATYDGAARPPHKKTPEGAKGSIAGAAFGGVPILVVSQTYDVHCQIAALLEELRTVACVKQPTPAKEEKTPPRPPVKPAAQKPVPPRPPQPPKPPVLDPFGAGPAVKPSAKGSSSGADDPFGQ